MSEETQKFAAAIEEPPIQSAPQYLSPYRPTNLVPRIPSRKTPSASSNCQTSGISGISGISSSSPSGSISDFESDTSSSTASSRDKMPPKRRGQGQQKVAAVDLGPVGSPKVGKKLTKASPTKQRRYHHQQQRRQSPPPGTPMTPITPPERR